MKTALLRLPLRPVCVGPCVGHGHGEGAVVAQRLVELVLELAPPDGLPPGAVPQGVPRLHHEALDDPVEDEVVEVAVLAVGREVLHRARALLRVQLHVNVAVVGVNNLERTAHASDGRLQQRRKCVVA
jgi:hypothetical protein